MISYRATKLSNRNTINHIKPLLVYLFGVKHEASCVIVTNRLANRLFDRLGSKGESLLSLSNRNTINHIKPLFVYLFGVKHEASCVIVTNRLANRLFDRLGSKGESPLSLSNRNTINHIKPLFVYLFGVKHDASCVIVTKFYWSFSRHVVCMLNGLTSIALFTAFDDTRTINSNSLLRAPIHHSWKLAHRMSQTSFTLLLSDLSLMTLSLTCSLLVVCLIMKHTVVM